MNKKLKNARAALKQLHDYAELLDIQIVSALAAACLKKLSAPLDSTPEFYKWLKAKYHALEDPVERGMVQLYWFFRHGCGLTGREAEVRVARIRNAFWKKHGVSEVPFRPEYRVGESRGCDAVHTAVRRFKGTSPRRNR
jgi:hypothetical protein